MDPAGSVNLKWRGDHSASIVDRFLHQLMNQEYVDATLSCQGQIIKVHRIILCATSSYFRRIFTQNPDKRMTITINSMSIEILRLLIEFMYTGTVECVYFDIEEFLRAADQLEIVILSGVLAEKNAQLKLDCANGDGEKLVDENCDCIIDDNLKKIKGTNNAKMIKPTSAKIHERVLRNEASGSQIVSSNMKDGKKIRRPPNAFMVFANRWRKILADKNGAETNRQISVRLGMWWKELGDHEKEQYYKESRRIQFEHKMKYPGYSYCPMEARERKRKRLEASSLKREANITSSLKLKNDGK